MGSKDKIILDTNIIIYLLKGEQRLSDLLDGSQLAYSVISEIELLGYPEIKESEELKILQFLHDCFPLEMDRGIRQLAIEMRRRYGLHLADAVIAATSYFHNYQLVTADRFLKGRWPIYFKV